MKAKRPTPPSQILPTVERPRPNREPFIPQALIAIVSILVGLILSVLSNWLYDALKRRGLFPETPTLKRLIVIILGFSPFLILVALPALVDRDDNIYTIEELKESGSWITIDKVRPARGSSFSSGEEIPIVITASYYLSGDGKSTEINLEYLRSYSPENGGNWYIVYFHPAEKGKHKALLSGTMVIPSKADLSNDQVIT